MESQSIRFKKERETKNKVRYTDDAEFGPFYVPKSIFENGIPDEITVEVSWQLN